VSDRIVPEEPLPDEPEREVDEDDELAGRLPSHRPGGIETPEADAIDQAIVEPLADEEP